MEVLTQFKQAVSQRFLSITKKISLETVTSVVKTLAVKTAPTKASAENTE